MTDQQQQHPITPPPELAAKWVHEIYGDPGPVIPLHPITLKLVEQAAQWGADQELDACRVEIVDGEGRMYIAGTNDRVCLAEDLRAARRPKPPSLKEQALTRLEFLEKLAQACGHDPDNTIRRALEDN